MKIEYQAPTDVFINEHGFLEVRQSNMLGEDDGVVIISYNNRLDFLKAVEQVIQEWG